MPAEWGSVGRIYDLEGAGFQGFGGSSKGRTVAEGYAPSSAIQNHVKFSAEAGSAIIFDIATFHTAQPNTSQLSRECVIMMYASAQAAQNHTTLNELVQDWDRAGRLSPSKRARCWGCLWPNRLLNVLMNVNRVCV